MPLQLGHSLDASVRPSEVSHLRPRTTLGTWRQERLAGASHESTATCLNQGSRLLVHVFGAGEIAVLNALED